MVWACFVEKQQAICLKSYKNTKAQWYFKGNSGKQNFTFQHKTQTLSSSAMCQYPKFVARSSNLVEKSVCVWTMLWKKFVVG